jgi:NAD(P)-dependent dehydrogenase (short-subunit alcohol dehydrogenase family)
VAALRRARPGAKVEGIAADLATAAGAALVITALPELDILVNNLGIFEPSCSSPASRRSTSRWRWCTTA